MTAVLTAALANLSLPALTMPGVTLMAATPVVVNVAFGAAVALTANGAMALTCRTRFATPAAPAEMAAVAVVDLRSYNGPPAALTATCAAPVVVRRNPRDSAVPLIAISTVAVVPLYCKLAAVPDTLMVAVADAYFTIAGLTLTAEIDAVRFASGIAPVSSDLLA